MSVVVVGSANLDLVYTVAAIPRPGETVLATGSARHPGGKGANQAVAAARAGASVAMVARVGADDAGTLLLSTLAEAGVGTEHVSRVDAATGTAIVTVDASGENAIVVDAGANGLLDEPSPEEADLLAGSDVLLLQLEVPLATVVAAARTALSAGTTVVLNAAPVQALPGELLALVDVLVVNEQEADALGGGGPDGVGALLTSVPAVVVTWGARGAVVAQRGGASSRLAAPSVTPVDTTGAGDTFCGALAAALDRGDALESAARFAVAAASLSVQRHGAVPSIPTREEIERALAGS